MVGPSLCYPSSISHPPVGFIPMSVVTQHWSWSRPSPVTPNLQIMVRSVTSIHHWCFSCITPAAFCLCSAVRLAASHHPWTRDHVRFSVSVTGAWSMATAGQPAIGFMFPAGRWAADLHNAASPQRSNKVIITPGGQCLMNTSWCFYSFLGLTLSWLSSAFVNVRLNFLNQTWTLTKVCWCLCSRILFMPCGI